LNLISQRLNTIYQIKPKCATVLFFFFPLFSGTRHTRAWRPRVKPPHWTLDWTHRFCSSDFRVPVPPPGLQAAARGREKSRRREKQQRRRKKQIKATTTPPGTGHRQLPRAEATPRKQRRGKRKAKSIYPPIHSTPQAAAALAVAVAVAVAVPPNPTPCLRFPRAWIPPRQRRDERACPRRSGAGSSSTSGSSSCVPRVFAGDGGAARARGLPLRSWSRSRSR
jgi:hypothetical protein